MTTWKLAVGVAALALSSMAVAGPGGGHGGGGGGGHGGGGQAQGGGQGGGGGKHGGGGEARGGGGGKHGGGGGGQPAFAQGGGGRGHGGGGAVQRGGGKHGGERMARQQSRGAARHVERQAQHAERQAQRNERRGERVARVEQRSFVRDHGRGVALATAGAGAGYAVTRYAQNERNRGSVNGCPPGLAAKDNGCLPPGQVRQRWGYGAPLQSQYADAYLPGAYRSWYPDNAQYSYRYGDGYAYRVDRSNNFVSGLFPLGDTGYYAPGEQYPAAYDFYNVPQPYQGYYPDNGAYDYRYGDGAIYQVDRSNGLIGSIVALLTGGGLGGGGGIGGALGGLGGGLGGLGGGLGGLGIGQALPSGYDVYNVPDQYRDRYADSADENYRYADGNIYQVDPKTQLIQQIISAVA